MFHGLGEGICCPLICRVPHSCGRAYHARCRTPAPRAVGYAVEGVGCVVEGVGCVVGGAGCVAEGEGCVVEGVGCVVEGAGCEVGVVGCVHSDRNRHRGSSRRSDQKSTPLQSKVNFFTGHRRRLDA